LIRTPILTSASSEAAAFRVVRPKSRRGAGALTTTSACLAFLRFNGPSPSSTYESSKHMNIARKVDLTGGQALLRLVESGAIPVLPPSSERKRQDADLPVVTPATLRIVSGKGEHSRHGCFDPGRYAVLNESHHVIT
jgi:hypothetical protein